MSLKLFFCVCRVTPFVVQLNGENTQTHWPNYGGVGGFVYIADPLCWIQFPVLSGGELPLNYKNSVYVDFVFVL